MVFLLLLEQEGQFIPSTLLIKTSWKLPPALLKKAVVKASPPSGHFPGGSVRPFLQPVQLGLCGGHSPCSTLLERRSSIFASYSSAIKDIFFIQQTGDIFLKHQNGRKHFPTKYHHFFLSPGTFSFKFSQFCFPFLTLLLHSSFYFVTFFCFFPLLSTGDKTTKDWELMGPPPTV